MAKKLGETCSGQSAGAARMAGQEDARQSRLAELILEWQGIPDMPPFESYRGELPAPRDDAFSLNISSIPI